jgi:radical SAM protein (TIGR01212 family)
METETGDPLENYRKYGTWLREKYNGAKVFKVVVDAGLSCPNRDGSKGYGGCTYCNVDSFTPELTRTISGIRDQLIKGIQRARENYQATKFIIYFQPNTNTYTSVSNLKKMIDEALSVDSPDIVGISIGTRPDCIDSQKLDLLESYSHQYDIDLEMGMESVYNETLIKINRGCTHEEFLSAASLLKGRNIRLCVHTIFGFPWESKEMMLYYADEINAIPEINFIKLHHLHIVKGSIMGNLFQKNPFHLFSLESYASFLSELLPRLREDLVIQRLFGISDFKYLIGPNWNLPKSGITSYIDQHFIERKIFQGSYNKSIVQ